MANELDYASELDQEIENPTGGSKGKTFFSISQDAPHATIRFLTYDPNCWLLVHNRYGGQSGQQSIQMPCLKQFGKECGYCKLGNTELQNRGIEMRKVFLMAIYWHEQGSQALFAYTTTGWSPLPAIHKMYRMRLANGIPVDAYDFILTRKPVPGKSASQTTVIPCDPSPLPKEAAELARWTPDTLKSKYLETMQAFAKKTQEKQATQNTTLDQDTDDIVL